MSTEEETRNQRSVQARQTSVAPSLHRSQDPAITVTRPSNAPPSGRPRGRTLSPQPGPQDRATTFSPHHSLSRNATPMPPRDNDRTRRNPGEGITPRPSMMSLRRPRRSDATLRQRRSVAAFPAAYNTSRRETMASARRPSLEHPPQPRRQGDAASFSLAGPQDTLPANLPYVHPAYTDLNPAYENPVNARPVWGLAKPLPRVVRPGMVPSVSELRQTIADAIVPDLLTGGGLTQEAADLEGGREDVEPKVNDVTLQLERAREEREARLLARIASEVPDLLGTGTPGESKPLLTPSSEVLVEVDEDEDESRDDFSPFPKMGESPDRSKGKARPASPHETIRQTEYAPQTHIGLDENDAAFIREELKVNPDLIAQELHKIEAIDYNEIHNDHTVWSVYRTRFREPLAELLAVIVQLTIGFSVDLAYTTSGIPDSTSWAWGLATMTAVYIAGGISGAHLNPAISIMLYIYRGFPLRKVPIYMAAQITGAFIATFIAYGLYRKNILAFGGSDLAAGGTAGAIITFPRYDFVDAGTAFSNEFVGTAVLAAAVLALGDDSNAPPGAGMSSFIIGLIVTVLSQAFATNTGAALNPSRDFGPRVALFLIGYGSEVTFGNGGYWIYGPWVATILGAIVGAFAYDVAIFVGGESPVNYPRRNIRRAGRKWRKGWAETFGG